MPKVSSVFIETLKNHKVDRFFCVPGESYLPVMNELVSNPIIDVVTCRHEGGAGFMAVADAKCTGEPGIAYVSRGPGATNISIAVHSAHQGGIPMIVFVGQVSRKNLGKMHLQEMDFTKTFADMTKLVEEIKDPEDLPKIISNAFKVAKEGIPGPVVISIPTDVLEAEISNKPGHPINLIYAEPNNQEIEETLDHIKKAQKPILVVGGELQFSKKSKILIKEIAKKFSLPVLCTYEHQDLIDNDSIYYAGELGLRPPEPIKQNALQADLVICIGHQMNGVPNMGYTFPSDTQKFIHVLPEKNFFNKLFKTDVSIISKGENFLNKLNNTDYISNKNTDWVNECHNRYMNNKATLDIREAEDGLDFGALIDELGKQVPEDSIITNDAGNFTSWMHHRFPFKSKMKLIGSEIGAMGMGIPAGIAASLRNNDKKVFVIVGDGGALMTGSELATASLKKAKIIVIVANNNHYGTIRYHQEVHYPKREHYATTLINPNFEEYAKSFGLKGFTINSIDQIQPTLKKAIDLNESVLIEYNMSLEINTSTTTIEELQN